jgi:hypothetical protein
MTTNFDINTLSGTQFAQGVFTATLLGGLTWQAPSFFGITEQPNGPYAFVDLTGLSGFTVEEAFTVNGTTIPFDTWYNGFNTLGFQNQADVSGDFQFTPLPPAIALFAGGLATLGLLGRRKNRKQAPETAQAVA